MENLYLTIIGEKKLKDIHLRIKSNNSKLKEDKFLKLGSSFYCCQYQTPSNIFDSEGRVFIRGDKKVYVEGIYLLYEKLDNRSLPANIKQYLRDKSIVYREYGVELNKGVEISQVSHKTSYISQDKPLGIISYDNEDRFINTFDILSGYKICDLTNRKGNTITFKDHHNNIIETEISPIQDRLKVKIRYKIKNYVEQAVPISFSIPLDKEVKQVEHLQRPIGGKWEIRKWFINPARLGHFLPFSQVPFILVRRRDQSYISFIDQDLDNLFFDISCLNGGLQINITRWLYPSISCDKDEFCWAFTLIPGYGDFSNALLRGMYHQEGKDNIKGAMGAHFSYTQSRLGGSSGFPTLRGVNEFCKSAKKNGISVVWYHGWFWRNGIYFPSLEDKRTYTTIWGYQTSIKEIKEIVKEFHKHNIKVCAYFQFAGVSEDVTHKFLPSLVRDKNGNSLIVGSDGGGGRKKINNIYANPDPEGLYGKSLLDQIEKVIKELKFDGIALDRTDRFDCTPVAPFDAEFSPIFDHSHFDGSANPIPYYEKHVPTQQLSSCSSITLQGKEFFKKLRQILNKHNVWLLSNVPKTLFIANISDGVLADIDWEPGTCFMYKAICKNTPCYIMTALWDHGVDRFMVDIAIASLYQAYPYMGGGSQLLNKQQRLLAVLPGQDDLPRSLFFKNGYSIINWNTKKKSILERFEGSYFEYYKPINNIRRITIKKDFIELKDKNGKTKQISYI